MKKFLVVWLSALCVICTAVFLTACTGKTEQLDGEYKPEYHKVFTDECDTFMNIDGKLDEDEWKNKKYLTNSYVVPDLNNDATVYYTVHMTEKGLYVGSYTDDTSLLITVLSAIPIPIGKYTLRRSHRLKTIRLTSNPFR